MSAFPWCASLAAIHDDVLGAVVRDVCTRHTQRSPELLRLGHRREHELVQVEYPEGGRTKREERSRWYLHVGVVLDGAAATDPQPVEDTHPALARDLQAEALRWADAWPHLHRHARGDVALASYHRTPLDAVIPATPPVHARHVVAASTTPTPKRVEAAAPAAPVAASPDQRGLFG